MKGTMHRNALSTAAIAICLSMVTASCKKSKEITPAPAPVKKLQQINWAPGYGANLNFSYDANGRLSKVEDADASVTYTYNGTSVQVKELRKSDNTYVNVISGTIDASGRIVSGTNTTSNSVYVQQWSFVYDAEGYLKKFTSTDPSETQIFDFTVSNGDYTQMLYSVGATPTTTETVSFYTDKMNLGGIDQFPVGFIYNDGLFGKINTHLVNNDQAIANGSASPLWTKHFTWSLDANGYVQSTVLSGSWASSATYVFQ